MATTIAMHHADVAEAAFDLDAHMARHVPLVAETFVPFGIEGWRVLGAVGAPTGDEPA